MPRRKPPPPEPPARPPRRKRGTGSVVVTPAGLLARLPAVDGRRPSKLFPAGAWAEAAAWLDAQLAPAPAQPTTAAPVTLSEWVDVWWETYVEPLRAPNTARWYRFALGLLKPHFDVPLADVRASMLQATVGSLAATRDPATVHGIVGVWRRMFDAAIDDELIARNPARRLVLPRRAKPTTVKRHVSPAEVEALWPAIRGHRFEGAYALLLGCGLRIGEVLGLHWINIDLAGARALIRHQWTNGHWRDVPKGRNEHWIPLPTRVVAALIRHRDQQPAGSVLVCQSPHVDYGRPRRKRPPDEPGPRPWSAQIVSRDLYAIVAALELPELTPHAARRGLVTALLDGGVPVATVADRVGHADTATTWRYAQPSSEGRALADELAERYLGGAPEAGSGTENTA